MYQKQIAKGKLKLDPVVLNGYRQVKVILSHLLHSYKENRRET